MLVMVQGTMPRDRRTSLQSVYRSAGPSGEPDLSWLADSPLFI
jgi:hypothetical protein